MSGSRHRKGNAFPDTNVSGDPRLLDSINRRSPNIAGGGVTHTFGSTILIPARKPRRSSVICPFGKIARITDDESFTKGISGGVIYCGDKNYNVATRGINLAVMGTWLLSIQLVCESNRDDDGEIFLGGIKTSSITDATIDDQWDHKEWTDPTSYNSNTNPDISTGIGTIVIPIGKFTVADGVLTFDPVACGNITVSQCGGILSHSRG